MPSTYDITINQGETFKLDVTYKIDDVAVDITGFSARMQIRPDYDSKVLIANLSNGNGLTITGASGKVSVLIPADDTANITFPEGVYDLEIQNPSGEVIRLVGGKFTLSKEVTR